jgi:hypothetical protein
MGNHNGKRIARFIPGDRTRTPESADAMNELVDAINALNNPRIARGDSDSVTIGETEIYYQLKKNGLDNGGSGAPFSSGTNPTHLNGGASMVLIDTTNLNDNIFVCGNFTAIKWGFQFNGSVSIFESGWIKRSTLAILYYNMIPRPEFWFVYNSTWISPQPLS